MEILWRLQALCLVILVIFGQCSATSSIDELADRLSLAEGSIKSNQEELKELRLSMQTKDEQISELQSKIEKCGCDRPVQDSAPAHSRFVTALKRQVSSAVLEDALSAFNAHFKHQGFGGPGDQNSLQTGSVSSSGSVYTRWGRKSCPTNTSLIYEGFAAGADWRANSGGGANFLCMPFDPQLGGTYNHNGNAQIKGVEYRDGELGLFPAGTLNQNVPCARCFSRRSATMMLPGKKTCPDSWYKEYDGYIMTSSNDGHHDRSMFECIDSKPEYIIGNAAATDGAVLYFVTVDCDGDGTTGHCPPYQPNKAVTCVVCTK